MGRAADVCGIHARILNRSKGPAVRSTRVQVDKRRYGEHAQQTLLGAPNIDVIEGLVVALVHEGDRIHGVVLADGAHVLADAVVVTTGTFLGGLLHTGERATPGGRIGEPPALGLSRHLAGLGFALRRLKTGTPPRLDGRTIDYANLEEQPSETPTPRFVWADEPNPAPMLPQVACHLTWTNPRTHEVIVANLSRSPMYSGKIVGKGPRYCPSIEDKVVRFADRERHQVFLEPEGLDTHSVYPSGISTSLPGDVQRAMIATIPGLERAVFLRDGYAVEYDAIDARALDHRLASKDLRGLFFAGQVNGTSGYEEAGAQGLVAGANAALECLGREPLVVGRDQGYTGVLVDDLVTQGSDEPYRMFTSRAEYRIVLREDNADIRLADLAHAAGLVDAERRDRAHRRDEAARALAAGRSVDVDVTPELAARAEAILLYTGYEQRMRQEIARMHDERADLPLAPDLDYAAIGGLSRECATRLAIVRPTSTAQAARIAGITPAALACVWAHARLLQRRARQTA